MNTSRQTTSSRFQSAKYARAYAALQSRALGPEFTEDEEGRRIRVWKKGDPDITKTDVRAWLVGLRVVEDLRDGLEFVRESYLSTMIREGWLKKDPHHGAFYYVTQKAADYFELPRVFNKPFPRF